MHDEQLNMSQSLNKHAQRDAPFEDEADEANHDASQPASYYYDDATGYEIYHEHEENDYEDPKDDKKNP
jgi:hypothetical protein